MLGFAGHFLIKIAATPSPSASCVTPVIWRRTVDEDLDEEHDEQTTLLIAALRDAGSSWRNLGDSVLANTSAAMARERQRIGRIETTSINSYVLNPSMKGHSGLQRVILIGEVRL
jgi:hypothetical protein